MQFIGVKLRNDGRNLLRLLFDFILIIKNDISIDVYFHYK